MRAKAKKTPMCKVRILAIELKGLAAPGEALKIKYGDAPTTYCMPTRYILADKHKIRFAY